MRISIVDYGMGNIGSLENMIKRAGGEAELVSDPDDVMRAEKLILPGVGAFDNAMIRLKELGLVEPLGEKVMGRGVPILCICLGAQLITESSEEGSEPGLGWIGGRTVKFGFPAGAGLRIPHMGWNDVEQKKESSLFRDMHEDPCFYFVHSYHLKLDDASDALTTTVYGYEFVSAVEKGNVFATQYHPEKSHKYGLRLIRNFVEL